MGVAGEVALERDFRRLVPMRWGVPGALDSVSVAAGRIGAGNYLKRISFPLRVTRKR